MKKCILHIDDEPEIRDLLKEALGSMDYDVLSAADADEAAKLVAARAPDLIISDFHLAHGDGLGVVQAMKKRFPTVPVILLTGVLIDPRGVQLGLGDLISSYLSKTMPLSTILAEVSRLCPG